MAGRDAAALTPHDAASPGDAIAALRRHLAAQPADRDARRRLAEALLLAGNAAIGADPAEAERRYREAIYTQPGYLDAIANLGESLVEQGRLPAALAAFRTALTLRPGDASTGFSYAVACLLAGDLAEGWRHFEARRAMAAWHYDRRRALPQWREGMPLAGRHLLLMAEQGIGDALQFGRYATVLARQGVALTLEVPAALLSLFAATAHVPVIGPDDAAPGCDLACPLMSLPLLCGTRLDSIPANPTTLQVPPARIATWRDRLGLDAGGPRIGLVCSGDARNPHDASRSIPFAAMAPLLRVGAARWVLLQPEIRDRDRAAIAAVPDLAVPGGALRDFVDTAAVIASLDLVIAADTGVAHLAASLGRPVWLLLPQRPDWRWMLHRHDSPWYPTVTLYRQPQRGDWHGVIDVVCRDLAMRYAAVKG
jgi:hypothetical protein